MESVDINKASFDDIVFENRNKSYGAYLLRKLYDKTVLYSLLISSTVLAIFLGIPLAIQLLKGEEKILLPPPKKDKEVTVIDVPIDPKTPPPPPLPKLELPQIKTVKFVPIEVAPEDKDVVEPPPPAQEVLNTTTASTENKEGEEDTTGTLSTNIINGSIGGIEDGTENDEPYIGFVGKEASFPGGINVYVNSKISQRLRDYIIERGVKGRLYIIMVINSDGSIRSVKPMPGREVPNCKLCTDEVVEILTSMPNWSPAENNGIPIHRQISFPIVF